MVLDSTPLGPGAQANNQFFALALAAEDYLAERAARGSREKFERALAKVADVEAPAEDAL